MRAVDTDLFASGAWDLWGNTLVTVAVRLLLDHKLALKKRLLISP